MIKIIKSVLLILVSFTIVSCSEIGNIEENINQADNILKQRIDKHYGNGVFYKSQKKAETQAGNWYTCELSEVEYKKNTIFFECRSPFIGDGTNGTWYYKKIGVIITN